MGKPAKSNAGQIQKSVLAALAASNELLLDELDRQQAVYAAKITALDRTFVLRAPSEAELAQIEEWEGEIAKLRDRKMQIILLEFAAMDSSSEVAALIGKVGAINDSLKKERKALERIEEKVKNIERLIKGTDAILKNLLTVATLFA
jgi:hypothetical protein